MGCAMNDSEQFEGVCRMGMPVFDRGGYAYHGRVKALADAARAAGLKF